MKAALIITLMLTIVPLDRHEFRQEPEEDARARYWTIANTIRAETEDPKLTAFLLATARHESGFDRRVHIGTLKGDISKRHPKGQSWGLYQIMCGPHASCKVPITDLTGGDIVGLSYLRTRYATLAGAEHLRFHIKRCGGNPYCVFRNYLGAPKGVLSQELQKRVNSRVYTYQRLLRLAEKKP